jgi:predicted nucleic acid-binding protein
LNVALPRASTASLHVAEPHAFYSSRPRLVVDATVVAAHLFAEPEAPLAAAALQARALHAPDLIDYELISVALKKIRRERLPQAAVTSALALVDGMAIERHRLDMSSVLRLADRYALTAYDAAYLSLAELLGAPLATFDEQLAAAAREHLAQPPPHGEGDAA